MTADCLEFLKFHITGSTLHFSQQELEKLVKKTIENITSIANSLDKTFKLNPEYEKIGNHEAQRAFFDNLEGYYDFCKFFEYYIFKTCSDFFLI